MPAFRHACLPACRHARVLVLRCTGMATCRPAFRCCGVAAFEKKCVDGSVAGSAWRRVPPTGLRLHMTRVRRGGTSVCEISCGEPGAMVGRGQVLGHSVFFMVSSRWSFEHRVSPPTPVVCHVVPGCGCFAAVVLAGGRRVATTAARLGGPFARFATAAFAVASSIRVGLG